MSQKQMICLMRSLLDLPVEELGNQTPLAKAKAPTLSLLAKLGQVHSLAPLNSYHEMASSYALFGLEEQSAKKAPLEAYALGYRFSKHQAVFSGHFASSVDQVIVDAQPPHLNDSEGRAFCAELNQKMQHQASFFIPSGKGRFLLVTEMAPLVKAANLPFATAKEAVGKKWSNLPPFPSLEAPELAFFQRMQALLSAHAINTLKKELEEDLVDSFYFTEGGLPLFLPPNHPSFTKLKNTLVITTSKAMQGLVQLLDGAVFFIKEEKRLSGVDVIKKELDGWLASYDTLIFDLHYLKESTQKGALLEKVKTIEWLDQFLLKELAAKSALHQMRFSLLPLDPIDIKAQQPLKQPLPAIVVDWKKVNFKEQMDAPSFNESFAGPSLSLSQIL